MSIVTLYTWLLPIIKIRRYKNIFTGSTPTHSTTTNSLSSLQNCSHLQHNPRFGFQHILVIVCYLSKFVVAHPLETKTSREVIESLAKYISYIRSS